MTGVPQRFGYDEGVYEKVQARVFRGIQKVQAGGWHRDSTWHTRFNLYAPWSEPFATSASTPRIWRGLRPTHSRRIRRQVFASTCTRMPRRRSKASEILALQGGPEIDQSFRPQRATAAIWKGDPQSSFKGIGCHIRRPKRAEAPSHGKS